MRSALTYVRPRPTEWSLEIGRPARRGIHAVCSGIACLLFFGFIVCALGGL